MTGLALINCMTIEVVEHLLFLLNSMMGTLWPWKPGEPLKLPETVASWTSHYIILHEQHQDPAGCVWYSEVNSLNPFCFLLLQLDECVWAGDRKHFKKWVYGKNILFWNDWSCAHLVFFLFLFFAVFFENLFHLLSKAAKLLKMKSYGKTILGEIKSISKTKKNYKKNKTSLFSLVSGGREVELNQQRRYNPETAPPGLPPMWGGSPVTVNSHDAPLSMGD